MRINHNQSGDTFSSGVLDSEAFSFAIDGKAFKLFSDTLYQNKPESIVRELCCNALDSHVMSGQPDRPFEVHVPSLYEPYLGIKDFGLGLSHVDMKGIYTVLFKSNKDKSNDAIGGFGLGSKTPFSYTDSFTVVSIHGGIKSHYTVMKNAEGIPKLDLMFSEETDENNGLEVQMAVERDDAQRFRAAIQSQLKFFKVKPILTNVGQDFIIPNVKVKDDYGKFYTSIDLHGLWVVQGQVGYPLDLNQFQSKIKNADNLRFFEVYNSGVLNFDIGEIEVTVSREGISYSTHTISNIEKFIAEVSPFIFKESVEKLKAITTDWDRLVFLNNDYANRGMARLAGVKFGDGGTFGDSSMKVVGGGAAYYQLSLTKAWLDDKKSANFHFSTIANNGKRAYWNSHELLITASDKVKIFIRDETKAAVARIKNYAIDNPSDIVYLIEHKEGGSNVDDSYIDSLNALLGGLKIQRISTLPEPPKNSRAVRGTPIVYSWSNLKRINLESIVQWTRTYDEEELEKGYYLEFDTYPRLKITYDEINLIELMLMSFDAPIYAIKSAKVDLLKTNPNFSCAITKAKEMLAEMEKKVIKTDLSLTRYKSAISISNLIASNNSAVKLNSWLPHDMERLPKTFEPKRLSQMRRIADKYVARINKSIVANGTVAKKIFDNGVINANLDNTYIFNRVVKVVTKDIENYRNAYPLLEYINEGYQYGGNNSNERLMRSARMTDYVLLVNDKK
jgi:hypothetical protein